MRSSGSSSVIREERRLREKEGGTVKGVWMVDYREMEYVCRGCIPVMLYPLTGRELFLAQVPFHAAAPLSI